MHFPSRAGIFHLLIAALVISTASHAADNTATQSLHQLFDQDWEYQMAHDPVAASRTGRPALERSVGKP